MLAGARALLRTITPERLLDPETWKRLAAFARVIPDGDVLPPRAKYSGATTTKSASTTSMRPATIRTMVSGSALPDLVASVLLTGKQPRSSRPSDRAERQGCGPASRSRFAAPCRSIRARKISSSRHRGAQATREPHRSGRRASASGSIRRSRCLATQPATASSPRCSARRATKNVADVLRHRPRAVRVLGASIRSRPGEYLLPTAGLAHYAAAVSAARAAGALRHRPGRHVRDGRHRLHGDRRQRTRRPYRMPWRPISTEDGCEAIRALSWAQVDAIVARFDRLNPYDRDARSRTRSSRSKTTTSTRRPASSGSSGAWRFPPSATRSSFAIATASRRCCARASITRGREDRYSEHGLGHLLNPTDPTSDDRSWIAQAWLAIVRRSLGLPTKPLRFANRVAVGQITVSSPEVMKPLAALNAGKPYAQQIKPFNFIISCHVAQLGHPIGADPERFHLIAPYETDPRNGRSCSGSISIPSKRYRISPASPAVRDRRARQELWRRAARVRVPSRSQVRRCRRRPCKKQTVGLLGRRHVAID